MARRIRVLFINCPTLATDAASFLILAQNKCQTVFQFEIHHFHICSKQVDGSLNGWRNRLTATLEEKHSRWLPWFVRQWLQGRNRAALDLRAAPRFGDTIILDEAYEIAYGAVVKYDTWVASRARNMTNNFDSSPATTLIVTETKLEKNYISFYREDIGIVSAAEWRRFFRPASALEYIVTSIQRLSLGMTCRPILQSHLPTRGCLSDYLIYVPDARISAFLGFLCETCRNSLKSSMSPSDYGQITTLVENHWIGDRGEPSSVAGILAKNYRYDLTRSTGLTPGFRTALYQSLQTEVGRYFFDIVKWATVAAITVLLAHYFPPIYRLIGRG